MKEFNCFIQIWKFSHAHTATSLSLATLAPTLARRCFRLLAVVQSNLSRTHGGHNWFISLPISEINNPGFVFSLIVVSILILLIYILFSISLICFSLIDFLVVWIWMSLGSS